MADAGEGAGAERPMRRSRMLSDDARLALQLQDEELKAARGMKRPKASTAAAAPLEAEPPAKKPRPRQRRGEQGRLGRERTRKAAHRQR